MLLKVYVFGEGWIEAEMSGSVTDTWDYQSSKRLLDLMPLEVLASMTAEPREKAQEARESSKQVDSKGSKE